MAMLVLGSVIELFDLPLSFSMAMPSQPLLEGAIQMHTTRRTPDASVARSDGLKITRWPVFSTDRTRFGSQSRGNTMRAGKLHDMS